MRARVDDEFAAHLRRLFGAQRKGVVFGLDRTRAVLAALGHPERQMGTVVQIGGTNGKGSTATMLAALLRAGVRADGGRPRVGLYTSPHLVSVVERISIDGSNIGRDEFCDVADRVVAAGGGELTFFEQLTAMAVVAFADARVDVAILEVGLGGRLDATTAADAEIAAVTGVALDHQEFLGDTIEAIAAEKAGIFRRGQRVVIGASGEATGVVALEAAATGAGAADVVVVDEAAIAAVPPLGLVGAHQRANAACALAVMRSVHAIAKITVNPEAAAKALLTSTHPGRFEQGARQPPTFLDGAHNPHGAQALAAAMVDLPRPRALIMAVSADKDVDGMIAALAPVVDEVVCTQYRGQRGLPAMELAARWQRTLATGRVSTAMEVGDALRATEAAGSVVVAGSLFVVGEARALLLGLAPDPVSVSDPWRPGTAGAS